jgi:hypothetical protein
VTVTTPGRPLTYSMISASVTRPSLLFDVLPTKKHPITANSFG